MERYLADVPEEHKNAILVHCPMCDIVYRVLKLNIKYIDNILMMETFCGVHMGAVYTPLTDEVKEKLDNAGIEYPKVS